MLIAGNALTIVNMKASAAIAHHARGIRHVHLDVAAITPDPTCSSVSLELSIRALLQDTIFYDDDELIADTESEEWSIIVGERASIPVPSKVLGRIEYSKENGRRCVACAIAEYLSIHLSNNAVPCALTAFIDARSVSVNEALIGIGELTGDNHAYRTQIIGCGISNARVVFTRAVFSAQISRMLRPAEVPPCSVYAFEFGEGVPDWCEDVVRKGFDFEEEDLMVLQRGTRALPLSSLGATSSMNAHFIRTFTPEIYLKEAKSLVAVSTTGGGALLLM